MDFAQTVKVAPKTEVAPVIWFAVWRSVVPFNVNPPLNVQRLRAHIVLTGDVRRPFLVPVMPLLAVVRKVLPVSMVCVFEVRPAKATKIVQGVSAKTMVSVASVVNLATVRDRPNVSMVFAPNVRIVRCLVMPDA